MRSIILSDNQHLTRLAWRQLLQDKTPASVIFEAQDKRALLAILTQNPDALVVIDYKLFDFEGIYDIEILAARFPQVSFLFASDELSYDFCFALTSSQHHFSILFKDSAKEELDLAIVTILRGSRYIANAVSVMLLARRAEKPDNPEYLTPTEKEILKDIALGQTTKEIAAKRFVSVHTIITHRKNIFRKLSVNTIFEATKYAMRAGIVDMAEYTI